MTKRIKHTNRAFLEKGEETLYVSFKLKHMKVLLKDSGGHLQRCEVCHASERTDQGNNIKSGLILKQTSKEYQSQRRLSPEVILQFLRLLVK